jgi:hypothetical protein
VGADPSPLEPPDALLLRFLAAHRFIAVGHVQGLLDLPARGAGARLRVLERSGHLRREQPFGAGPSFWLITARGLRAIDSRLRPPRLSLACCEHELGMAWLWLAARQGAFGALAQLVGEREMRSRDATRSPGAEPMAVRLGGYGAGGRERLHYPDLQLFTRSGKRVALELELSAKGRTRREQVLTGYAADARIDVVLYLVESRSLGRSIQRSARRMGIEHLVHVQMARAPDRLALGRTGGRTAQRSRRRSPAGASR